MRLQYLDAVRNTQTRLSAGGPKQKSACASRTETRDPQLLYKTLPGVKNTWISHTRTIWRGV
jgi:hypothetical protein